MASVLTLRRRLDALVTSKDEVVAQKTTVDETYTRRKGVDIVRESDRLIREVHGHGNMFLTEEGQQLVTDAEALKVIVGKEVFGLIDPLDSQEGKKTDGD